MKKIRLLILNLLLAGLLFLCGWSQGQVLTFRAGPALDKLDWKIGNTNVFPYDEALIGYSVFAGVDYWDHRFFNLSTNLGLLRRGGKDDFTVIDANGNPISTRTEKATLDYLSVNTTMDLKYPIDNKIIPFLSLGPRYDFLISHSKQLEDLDNLDELVSSSFGLNLGVGLWYDQRKIRVGLRADYCLNFSKIAEWPAESGNLGGEIKDKTFLINLTFGYKLYRVRPPLR